MVSKRIGEWDAAHTFPFNVVAANSLASASAPDCRIPIVTCHASAFESCQSTMPAAQGARRKTLISPTYRLLEGLQISMRSLLLLSLPTAHSGHRRQNRRIRLLSSTAICSHDDHADGGAEAWVEAQRGGRRIYKLDRLIRYLPDRFLSSLSQKRRGKGWVEKFLIPCCFEEAAESLSNIKTAAKL